jgi:hypothetical protein
VPPELRAAISKVTDAAVPVIIEMAARVRARTWDADAAPPRMPVEHVLGGLRITVPGRWRQEPPDPRGVAWAIDEQAMVSLTGLGFEKRVPTPTDYLQARPVVSDDGFMRVALNPLSHPVGQPAAEIVECAAADPRRPLRVLRVLYHPQMLLILKLDTDGWVADRLGAELAHAFTTIG